MKIQDFILPAKSKDFPTLGQLVRLSNKSLPFLHISDTDKNQVFGKPYQAKGLNCIGMELEVKFTSNPSTVTSVRAWAMKNKMLNRQVKVRHAGSSYDTNVNLTLETVSGLSEFYLYGVSNNITPLVYQHPHKDDGCIEHCVVPVSLTSLPIVKFELSKLTQIISLMGGIERSSGAGIHLSADRSLFGLTKLGERETTANFILWLYLNCDFMLEFSYRDEVNILRASIDYFLDDPLRKLSDTERVYKAVSMKESVLDAITGVAQIANNNISSNYFYGESGTSSIRRMFNISWNNDNRDINEFRWFGSTLDVNRIISWYEWYFAIIEFCRTMSSFTVDDIRSNAASAKDTSMKEFCEFVKTNKTFVPHLYNYLRDNVYSKNYFTGTALCETITFDDSEIFNIEGINKKETKEKIAKWIKKYETVSPTTTLATPVTPPVTPPTTVTPQS